jgi:hypothetical protein
MNSLSDDSLKLDSQLCFKLCRVPGGDSRLQADARSVGPDLPAIPGDAGAVGMAGKSAEQPTVKAWASAWRWIRAR